MSRRAGFVVGSRLCCACGARMAERAVILDSGIMRCDHKAVAGGPECGRLVYVVVTRLPGGARLRFAAEITSAEGAHLREAHLDVEGVLRYLGLMLDEPHMEGGARRYRRPVPPTPYTPR